MFEGAGELVGAAGAAAFAVYAFEKADDILHLAAQAEARDPLGVAVTAFHEAHAADGISFCFNVYAKRADGVAGLEGGLADAVFGGV